MQLFHFKDMGVFIFDETVTLTSLSDANPPIREWLIKHDISLPLNVKEMFDLSESDYNVLLDSLEHDHTYTLTAPVVFPNNTWMTVYFEKIQLGNTIAIVGSFHIEQDIITLKSLAKDKIYEDAPYGVFTLNTAGELVNSNINAIKLLHHTDETEQVLHYLDFVMKEDHEKAIQAFSNMIKGNVTELELSGLTKDGIKKQLYIKGMPLIHFNDVCGVVCSLTDITEAYKIKKRLKQSEIEYQSLFTENIDAVLTFDLTGHITDLNESTARLTGYDKKALLGKRFDFLIEPDLLTTNQEFFFSSTSGTSVEYETVIRTKSQAKRSVQITLIPILVDGHTYGINCIAKDISDQKQLSEDLFYFAYHDHLTGLKNQISLTRDIDRLIQNNSEQTFALLFIDLDRFKLINDTLGHAKGDELLKKIAKRIISTKNDQIDCYRYGGDEFIIVYKEPTLPQVKSYANKLIHLMSKPYQLEKIDIVNTPTIGVSMYPHDATTVEKLIKKADQAMYYAKNNERGTVQLFHANLPVQMESLLEVESSLRKAIDYEEFVLHYQPQVNTETGKIHGMEALIRWQQAERLVSPLEFIPLAEETGLIIPIGEWVIEEVARMIQILKKEGIELPISINLSIRQFYQRNIVERIKAILMYYEVEPSLITIEITESMAMDATTALIVLEDLKALGVKLAIDDFGTGYSSLNYLKQFPIDYLKIDQSFIFDILDERDNQDITDTIILLGHRLHMSVVAEGVETKAHVELLKEMHCDLLQGYYFSKPLPEDDLIRFIKSYSAQQYLPLH